MTTDANNRPDPYALVEQWWPYDGPYSDEHTTVAALVIGRLGRYVNNATTKPAGLPYAAVVGRLLAELHAAVAGHEQLLDQLARYLDREAANPNLYDDRRDWPGAHTAHQAADALRHAIPATRDLAAAMTGPTQLTDHLGSE